MSEIEHVLAEHENRLPGGIVREDAVRFNFERYGDETTKQAIVEVRVGQQFFRSAVLANFERRCCVTGISEPSLLTASHIVPWSHDPKNRHNPANGLSLSATFDRAFDVGLMTIDSNLRVVLSSRLREHKNDRTREFFQSYDGAAIECPIRFLPDPDLLSWHNKTVFKEA